MKSKIILSSLVLILLMLAISFAIETYDTASVDGTTPIIIDGELSDWEMTQVISINIDTTVKFYWDQEDGREKTEKVGYQHNENNISALFQCFIDESNLYAAFIVTDDILIFGRQRYGIAYLDDCVEILLHGDQPEPAAYIWVTADSQGNAIVEGAEPLCLERFRFPHAFLREQWGIKAAMSQTENGYIVEIVVPLSTLSAWLGWEKDHPLRINLRVYDNDNTGEVNHKYIEWERSIWNEGANTYSVNAYNEITFDNEVSSASQQSVNSYPSDIEVVLTEPDQSASSNIYVFQQLGIAHSLEKLGFYDEAINELRKIFTEGVKTDSQNKVKLFLARNSFFIGDFNRSKQLCEELLNSEIDPKTGLDARMLLLSIERKMNQR